MPEILTDNQRWLTRRYLAYHALTHFWFVSAVWLYFYRIYITDQQVGLLDGLAFAIGLIAEVPSGALADKFGRGKMVKLGQVLTGVGFLIQLFGGLTPIFVGQVIFMIGVSFVSGADEALFFGKINFDRKSLNWRKLVMRGSQVALVVTLVATVLGGWLHTIDPRIPWILSGLSCFGAVIVVWRVKDIRPKEERQSVRVELGKYFACISRGFDQFWAPKLFLYVPIIVTVQGLFYSAGWGLLRPVLLDRFHFSPFLGSVVIALSSLVTVGILALMHKYAEHMSERRVLVLISLSAMAGLLLSLADIGAWGFFVIFALYAGDHILYPFMSEVLNNRAPENERATVLSIASFFRVLPYVVLAPIIGYLNTHDNLEYFLVSWSIIMGVAILLYLSSKKKDDFVSLVEKDIGEGERVPELSVGQ